MPRIGIISNPRSHAHLAGQAGLGRSAEGLPHAAPDGRPALAASLAEFSASGVELLVVNGGDGTLREVLGMLPQAWAGPAPIIAPLAAGRTNLAARTLGQSGKGEPALRRLVDAAATGTLRHASRRLIEVTRLGGEAAPPLRGFLFGAAAFAQATAMADEGLSGRRLKDNAVIATTLLMASLQTLSGRGSRGAALRRGVPLRLAVDGQPAMDHARFMLLATTLDRLMFGLWPFWGPGEGTLRWLDVAAPPRQLASGLWSLLRHRPPRIAGWDSGRADRLEVTLTEPFVLDGEVFQPGPRGIALTASTPLVFAAP